ncbi:general stress protein 26 [Motilibacter peucedani]|uniref:General stress protein 26 n=1 Tax=Motilibacter peucedani TaxID=598650 RepID=A0A420XPG0_9ACTN|nr:general stress protein 26 [Motilibacter peucedani]
MEQPVSHEEGVAKVAALIKDIRTCMLTTVDEQGRLVSRPMAVQQVEFDGDLWFAIDEDSRKVHQVEADAEVGVAFSSNDAWVSVAGRAQVVHDLDKAKELWNPALTAWFPDGPETPGLALLRVEAESAEYWDTPGGKVTTLISYVKARVTGTRFDGGENEVVELS